MQPFKHISDRLLSLGISILLGGSAFLFYLLLYPCHLYFQEQNQMFLFTTDYWMDKLSRPGGFCEYLSCFFIQFYIHSWMGAAIQALLLVALQRLVLVLLHKFNIQQSFDVISAIPSLLYWMLLCNDNYILTALIAQLMVLIAGIIYTNISKASARIICSAIGLLLLYALAGGIYWTYSILVILFETVYFKHSLKHKPILLISITLCITIILPLTGKYIIYLPYPLELLWRGISYYRFPETFPSALFITWAITLSLPFVMRICTRYSTNRHSLTTIFPIAGVCCMGIVLLSSSCDLKKEREMKYDYLLRYGLWNRIIKQSHETPPQTSLEMAIINLSLAQTGKMGDYMFHYPQNHPEFLLPPFSPDFRFSFAIADIYYHIGMINIAQRLTFEGMESIPDYQKSGRAIQRLAETNLINGDTEVAHKYMNLLKQTLFYRIRATQGAVNAERQAANDEKKKRKKETTCENDLLFLGNSTMNMLRFLTQNNPDNRIACEYLVAYSLLNKDLKSFIDALPLMRKWYGTRIPLHYQEALVQLCQLNNSEGNSSPINIGTEITDKFKRFMHLYSQSPHDERLESFCNTYWYYYYGL